MASAATSVWGTSERDVYIVGGDAGDGKGPLVEHYDGTAWTRLDPGVTNLNLWWVFGPPGAAAGGPVFMGGEGGTILRYQGGAFTKMTTPANATVFGLWGASATEMWAVGGSIGGQNGAFAWKLDGDAWIEAPGFPTELAQTDAMWKMFGRSASDAWIVGTNGKTVRWDGSAFTKVAFGGESLFTVHADADRFVAVGGFGTGLIVENTGSGWTNASPMAAPSFSGVYLSSAGDFAVGDEGAIYERDGGPWTEVATKLTTDETFHAVWVDPSGGVWAVGGQVRIPPLVNGIVVHRGSHVEEMQ